jgi:RHH-type proline utilization regulon transcriptional repressor/proline dehydrogenase/delta 1-pyrroline-5-carboxylate dehydrogenase
MLVAQTPHDAGKGGVKLALGTHNVRSLARAIATLEKTALPKNAVEFQALRGMADDMKPVLAQRGWRVREYMPLGDLIPGMAYLVRRLLENTSNQSWLRAGQADEVSDEMLLASPVAAAATHAPPSPAPSGARRDDFINEPLRDFSQSPQREAFHNALANAKVSTVLNSSTPADAGAAITRAQGAFPQWRDAGPETWTRTIRQAAAILRANRDQLAAEIVLESHKTWSEADGDVCEAIDFCQFYARESADLFTPQKLSHVAGELNQGALRPRGIAAIIAPWNFSLSIPTGMTVAALVTGNAAILKPAEQTPAIARRLCEALWQAGVPRDILHFLPGPGETTGAALAADPRICNIAFTGSAAVGMAILRAAHSRGIGVPPMNPASLSSSFTPQDFLIPRVIAEMGGKNAMIIDESADLDEAVLALRQSAFGYAGQKCSAASRAIVLDSIHDAFVKRLIESTQALVLGDPQNPATDIGPVIDAEAAEKIRRYIEIGKQEATLACPLPTQNSEPGTQNLIPPHIFTSVLPSHRIAREEIFGPVLSVLRARNFDHALELANDVPYKLTGGLFSRTPSHLARARSEFHVGNLYLNRTITGALVGRQPFGGAALSGTGPKAGGKRYLLPFTDEQSITENALRRGFAPAEGE